MKVVFRFKKPLFLAVLCAVAFLSVGSADAAPGYAGLPQKLPDSAENGDNTDGTAAHFINISNAYQNDISGNGVDHPAAFFKVYSQTPSSSGYRINVKLRYIFSNSANCDGVASTGGIFFEFINVGADEQGRAVVAGSAGRYHYDVNTNGCGDFSFIIPPNFVSASSLPEHQGVYTVGLKVYTPERSVPPFFSYFFQLNTYGNSPDTRLGFLPDPRGSVLFAAKDPSVPYNGRGKISMPFGASCVAEGGGGPLVYGDDDYDTAKQPHSANMSLHLLKYDSYSGILDEDLLIAKDNADPALRVNPGAFSSGGQVTYPPPWGYWEDGKKYVLEYRNVTGGNGIFIQQPFDSGDFEFGCTGTPTPVIDYLECPPEGCIPAPSEDPNCYNVVVNDPGVLVGASGVSRHTRTIVTITGADPPVFRYMVQNSDAAAKNVNGTNFSSTSHTFNYTSTGRDDSSQDRIHLVLVHQYLNASGFWYNYPQPNSSGTPTRVDKYSDQYYGRCHQASCNVSVVGNLEGNHVGAGQDYTVNYSIMNTGSIYNSALPVNLSGANLSLTENNTPHPLSEPIGQGQTVYGSYPGTAPYGSTPYYLPLNPYPDYYGGIGNIGIPPPDPYNCGTSFPVYVPFNVTVKAGADLTPDNQDPDTFTSYTWICPTGSTDVDITTDSEVYKVTSAGTSYYSTDTGGTYNGGSCNIYTSPLTSRPVSGFQAGDKYCAHIHAEYQSAYVGPGGPSDVIGKAGPPPDDLMCPTIHNKPTFKAYNGAIMSGGYFNGESPTANDGGLAGWNNNENGYDFGSGTQLSALALTKIVGFASAQTVADRPPNDLSMANITAKTTSRDSPDLGGEFAGRYQLHDVSPSLGDPKQTFTPLTAPGATGTYITTGNINLNNSPWTIGNGVRARMVVYGDVYIDRNISYDASTPSATTDIPFFSLTVTGNIYIGPNVTQLDGIYTAKGSGQGKIYTCSQDNGGGNFSRVTANEYYACANQLTVNGSFVANKVNLMRTYGSLRDEKPTINSGAKPTALDWGNPGIPGGDTNCVQVYEPAELGPGGDPAYNPWRDNFLCVPGSYGPNFQLAWTWFSGNTAPPPQCPASVPPGGYSDNGKGCAGLSELANQGYAAKDCVNWNAKDGDTWGDNYLCAKGMPAGMSITFETANNSGANKSCRAIAEGSDNEPVWGPPGNSDYFICLTNTASVSAPTSLKCSNAVPTTPPPKTCAAEVFKLTPELYVWPEDPNANYGATKFDAITSLPPIL